MSVQLTLYGAQMSFYFADAQKKKIFGKLVQRMDLPFTYAFIYMDETFNDNQTLIRWPKCVHTRYVYTLMHSTIIKMNLSLATKYPRKPQWPMVIYDISYVYFIALLLRILLTKTKRERKQTKK